MCLILQTLHYIYINTNEKGSSVDPSSLQRSHRMPLLVMADGLFCNFSVMDFGRTVNSPFQDDVVSSIAGAEMMSRPHTHTFDTTPPDRCSGAISLSVTLSNVIYIMTINPMANFKWTSCG